jgi:GntR family transcriptional regulator
MLASYLYRHLNMIAPNPLSSREIFRGVDPSDPAPLHAQIERELRQMIKAPEFRNGGLFPDELTLANRFGVSRGTVRVSLSRLVDQRLLERKRGIGTRVLPAGAESSIGEWRSFSQEMARRNIKVECYFIEARRVPAPAEVVVALQIGEGMEVLRLDRVRGWEGRPVLHSRSWFHPRLQLAESADYSRPLYQLIEETTGAIPESAREEFSAVAAPGFLARRLKVRAGEPLLMRRHTVYDRGRRPIEFAEVHYMSSRFTLTLDLKRNS